MDFSQLEGVSVQEWLDGNVNNSNDSEIIRALIRSTLMVTILIFRV